MTELGSTCEDCGGPIDWTQRSVVCQPCVERQCRKDMKRSIALRKELAELKPKDFSGVLILRLEKGEVVARSESRATHYKTTDPDHDKHREWYDAATRAVSLGQGGEG